MSVDPFSYLLSLEQFGVKFGLDNMRALVDGLGHPEHTFRAVHIAGTNGKGSVTAIAEAALRAAGFRTGRYTSPHLVRLAERFALDGVPVSDAVLGPIIARVRDTVLALQQDGTLSTHPTFFEVTTAAAFELFKQARVDVAVCEVGLGGRLDATNVLMPLVSAITSIGFDHEKYLGGTLMEIATEKAGIVKPGVPVIVGRMAPESARVISEIASARGARVVAAHEGVTVHVRGDTHDAPQILELQTPVRAYGEVPLALAGRHQIDNAIVAVRVLEEIDSRGVGIGADAIVHGLANVRWPGRLDRVRLADGREALLDAAHNPEGARALAAFLADRPERVPLVFALMRDKDARAILAHLTPAVSAFVLTRASHPRSSDPHVLAEVVRELSPSLPVFIEETPAGALAAAWRLSPRIVVAGSIFLLGDVMEGLRLS